MEFVDVSELKNLLRSAYEEGNRGYLGMRDDFVDKTVDDFLSSRKASVEPSFTLTTNMNVFENGSGPYYHYSTMTMPPPEIGQRDEVV
jgi:hypothetical protein